MNLQVIQISLQASLIASQRCLSDCERFAKACLFHIGMGKDETAYTFGLKQARECMAACEAFDYLVEAQDPNLFQACARSVKLFRDCVNICYEFKADVDAVRCAHSCENFATLLEYLAMMGPRELRFPQQELG
ncbi:MAG: hypothetical protein CVV27_09915 [Candidatus Melainabacteria bacterium HGW-Melainabacteria-1]|nr:MAG: hypothetical protein CVV27_09915 [Candidatus Melainabacteria bacterium HGW-Melainabacteria-1]